MSITWAKEDVDPAVLEQSDDGASKCRSNFLSEIYQRHYRELQLFVYKKFGNGPPDPEDVIQQAFAQFVAQKNLDRIKNPRAFLYRTAQNIVINHHRHNQIAEKHRQTTLRENKITVTSDDITPERVISKREMCKIVEETIHNLPKRRRELFLMHRLHDLSYAEIARQTGLSETAVKKHVALAVAACGAALDIETEPHDTTEGS